MRTHPDKHAFAGIQLVFAIALAALLTGCATTMEKGSHSTVEPGFLANETQYSWVEEGPVDLIDESGYISPAIIDQMKTRVVQELATKGFVLVPADQAGGPPPMQVQLYLRARRELQSLGPQGRTGPCVYPDCWRSPHDASVQMVTRTVGFLAADVYYNDKPIWRGWVERMLYPSERDKAMVVLNEAVPILFKSFPP